MPRRPGRHLSLFLFVTLFLAFALPGEAPSTSSKAAARALAAKPDMPFEQLIKVGSDLINEFWVNTSNANRWTYKPPSGLFYYNSAVATGCGPAVPQNAFYCTADNSIYYHDEFIRGMYSDAGDFAAVGVLAHEWGHLAQRNLGILDATGHSQYYSIALELQADCFAGAFTKYVEDKKMLEDGDVDEAGETLFRVGDRKNVKWSDPTAHGRPIQRVRNFLKGYEEGVGGCFTAAQTQRLGFK